MVTKTRLRPNPPPLLYTVRLSDEDQSRVAEVLGIHPENEKDKLDVAICDLESLLAHAKSRLNLVETYPLPAHIIAELTPIAESAAALAEMLNLQRMHRAVWRELGTDIDDLGCTRDTLIALHHAASNAIERLSGQENRGMAAQAFSESLATVNAAIEKVFNKRLVDKLEGEEREGALNELLGICRGYLPNPPNALKTKKKSSLSR